MPAKLRNLELVLLIFAVALGAVAIVLVQFGTIGRLDADSSCSAAGRPSRTGRAHCHALRRPRRRPVPPADRHRAQRPRHRDDLPHRHRQRRTGWESAAVRQIVWSAIAHRAAPSTILLVDPQPPRPVPVHLPRRRSWRSSCCCCRSCPASGRRSTARGVWIGIGDVRHSSPVRSRRSPWRSSSPATWCATATPCRWSGARSSACGSRALATSVRSSSSGRSRWRSSSSSATSAPRCSTSACSS